MLRSVIPAKAGIHVSKKYKSFIILPWVPASAGTTLRQRLPDLGSTELPQGALLGKLAFRHARLSRKTVDEMAHLADVLANMGEIVLPLGVQRT